MTNLMEPQYNELLESFLAREDGAGREELLAELNGNHSPTLEEIGEAIHRMTRRFLALPRRRKILKTPDFTFDTPNPSSEQLQAKLRDWARDPFNWEYVEVEGDKE